jgi:hypothetical protein
LLRNQLTAIIACLSLSSVWAAARPTESKPASAGGAEIDLKRLLADPPGASDGRDRLAGIQQTLEAASQPLDQAAAELAMANVLVALPPARPMTRWIIGLQDETDLARVHETATDAQQHLARARKLLSNDDEEGKERRRELRSAASTLEAFAKLFAACSDRREGTDYKQACEDAAVGLAKPRESEKPQVAAAALLWQAFAWDCAGKSDRALSTLPDALTTPERLPYDFAARLLRCRILIDTGQSAAVIALTMRMQPLCEEWFPQQDKDGVAARQRLVAAVQWKATQAWLKVTASAPAAARLEKTLASAREPLSGDGDRPAVYHLESAVPILVETPALPPAHRDEGATRPAESAPEE